MRSFTSPEDVPAAIRRKQLTRPQTFYQPRQQSHPASALNMLPTDPNVQRDAGRTDLCGRERYRVKKSRSPKELDKILRAAASANRIDASVVGAAMQTCGYKFWWHALLDLRCWQKELAIELYPIQRNIFITALAKASKGREHECRRQALQLAREMWQDVTPATDSDTFKSGLSAVLTLCAAADLPDALTWAEEIWGWAKDQQFQPGDLTVLDYMRVLERYNLYDRVDGLLLEFKHAVNVVVLGGLLNTAAEKRDWQRSDALWDIVVKELGVVPNVICYTAWSKAHLLGGKPTIAAAILGSMFKSDLEVEDDRSPLELAQALLIVCHSSPTPANFRRLEVAKGIGEELIQKHSTRATREQWDCAMSYASRLYRDPASLTLHDVLITRNVRSGSVMMDWPAHAAGSNYLDSP